MASTAYSPSLCFCVLLVAMTLAIQSTSAVDSKSWTLHDTFEERDAVFTFSTGYNSERLPSFLGTASPDFFRTCSESVWITHYGEHFPFGFTDICTTWQGFTDFPTSVRRVGTPDLDFNASSLHVYSDYNYRGLYFSFTNPTTLPLPDFGSLIFFGHDALQLFTELNGQGDSYCVPVNHWWGPYTYVQDIRRTLGVEAGQIKSFRYGCSPGNSVRMAPSSATMGGASGSIVESVEREVKIRRQLH